MLFPPLWIFYEVGNNRKIKNINSTQKLLITFGCSGNVESDIAFMKERSFGANV